MTKENLPVGPIGENIPITHLLWGGWAPVNVNHLVTHAPNIDILAAKGTKKVSLQVKTSGPNSRSMLQLGRKFGPSIFNDKEGPLADFIIMVRLSSIRDYECYVVPVAEAERVARVTADDWLNTLKRDGSQRDNNFPHCIRFELNKSRPDVSDYKEKWKCYLDAWNLLEQMS